MLKNLISVQLKTSYIKLKNNAINWEEIITTRDQQRIRIHNILKAPTNQPEKKRHTIELGEKIE